MTCQQHMHVPGKHGVHQLHTYGLRRLRRPFEGPSVRSHLSLSPPRMTGVLVFGLGFWYKTGVLVRSLSNSSFLNVDHPGRLFSKALPAQDAPHTDPRTPRMTQKMSGKQASGLWGQPGPKSCHF